MRDNESIINFGTTSYKVQTLYDLIDIPYTNPRRSKKNSHKKFDNYIRTPLVTTLCLDNMYYVVSN